jgi:hypothetical protein
MGHGVTGTLGCRKDVNCKQRFDDAKRVASNCDRVLYTPDRGGWSTTDYFVAVPDDDRDWWSGVYQSDHDPVIAIAEHQDGATMLVVTFNCEAQSVPDIGGDDWTAFLQFVERKAGALEGFSAVCLCLQEAGPANTMAADLRRYLEGSHTVVESRTIPRMAKNFAVHCVVALSHATYGLAPATDSRVMHFGGKLTKLVARSKGAAFVDVLDEPAFIVGSAHLPIDTRDKPSEGGSLGFGLRKAALQYMAEQVVDTRDGFAVVAGDLNFRRHVKRGQGETQDRDELRASGILDRFGLAELHELESNTCKLATVPTDAMGVSPTNYRFNAAWSVRRHDHDDPWNPDVLPSAAHGIEGLGDSDSDSEADSEGDPSEQDLVVSDTINGQTVVSTLQDGGRGPGYAAVWAALGAITLLASMIK